MERRKRNDTATRQISKTRRTVALMTECRELGGQYPSVDTLVKEPLPEHFLQSSSSSSLK